MSQSSFICATVSVADDVHLSSRRNVMFHLRKILSTSFLFSFDPHGKLKFIKEPIGQTELGQLSLIMILSDLKKKDFNLKISEGVLSSCEK